MALLYFAAAQAGLMVAVVGSTVSLAWQPSGTALVAILVFVYRMTFGIVLGASLANAWTGLPTLLAAGIAVGKTLCAPAPKTRKQVSSASAIPARRVACWLLGNFRNLWRQRKAVLGCTPTAAALLRTLAPSANCFA